MKSVTPKHINTQLPKNDVPVLMDALVEKGLKHQSKRPNQTASLNSQLTNQLRKLRKENATLQMKSQQTKRYAERVQADRDEFRKQVIRLLKHSKLLEKQLEERQKSTWNEKLSITLIKNKTSGILVIKNHCSTLLQKTYNIFLQKTNQIKALIEKRNTHRLESNGKISNKKIRKPIDEQQRNNKNEIKKQHQAVEKNTVKKVIKHDYIEI